MDINFNIPGINEQASHTLNLPAILDSIKSVQIKNECTLKDGLKIQVRPLTYKDMTNTSLTTFQQQKLYSSVQDSKMTDEEKTKRFDESFKALTELSMGLLLRNIEKITTPDGTEVTDPVQIKEFVDNADAGLITELQDKLNELRAQGSTKPAKLKATEEQIKKGAPASYEIPVTFDTANFFV